MTRDIQAISFVDFFTDKETGKNRFMGDGQKVTGDSDDQLVPEARRRQFVYLLMVTGGHWRN